MTKSISLYKKISDIDSQETIPFDIFLENIRSGFWQDIVLPLRAITDKSEQYTQKQKAPSVTIAGKFNTRTDAGLAEHSTMIAIDIDNVDPEATKTTILNDPHIVAAFTSISGRGLCVIFNVNPEKHKEAFQGIGEYLFSNYKLISDPTSINVSRPRFVSYDPYLYQSSNYKKFTLYPKEKPPKKVDKAIYSAQDFREILKQIVSRRINITQDSYAVWLRIGFALSHKFGEEGRNAFHIISQYSSKYDSNITDKQYNACLKHRIVKGNEATISMFYYYCKQSGIDIYSSRTRLIAYTTQQQKKAGQDQKQIAESLEKFEGITDAEDIIKQVYDNDIELNDDTLLDQLEIYVRQNYNLRWNEITRYLENNGVALQKRELNSIYIKAKKVLDKITYDIVERLIYSDFVPGYNPFNEYIQEQLTSAAESGVTVDPQSVFNGKNTNTPLIAALFNSINSKDKDYTLYFGRKWLCGVISALHGEHSPLVLVLSGETQNTGKTQFFRRLLPKALKKYYAESKLDEGKDDRILMTQKLIVMDDEMGGKSKKENKLLKDLTSKDVFSLREPYGHGNVDLKRLAVLCGTTNDNEILNDPTGNRRIIPIMVYSIDWKGTNSIDKDALFMEAYYLWKSGYNWELTKEDIAYLKQDSEYFEVSNLEQESILRYYEPGDQFELTATDIKIHIEKLTNQKLLLDRVAKELKRLGFKQQIIKKNRATRRLYSVNEISLTGSTIAPEIGSKVTPVTPPTGFVPVHEGDDLPFN